MSLAYHVHTYICSGHGESHTALPVAADGADCVVFPRRERYLVDMQVPAVIGEHLAVPPCPYVGAAAADVDQPRATGGPNARRSVNLNHCFGSGHVHSNRVSTCQQICLGRHPSSRGYHITHDLRSPTRGSNTSSQMLLCYLHARAGRYRSNWSRLSTWAFLQELPRRPRKAISNILLRCPTIFKESRHSYQYHDA